MSPAGTLKLISGAADGCHWARETLPLRFLSSSAPFASSWLGSQTVAGLAFAVAARTWRKSSPCFFLATDFDCAELQRQPQCLRLSRTSDYSTSSVKGRFLRCSNGGSVSRSVQKSAIRPEMYARASTSAASLFPFPPSALGRIIN